MTDYHGFTLWLKRPYGKISLKNPEPIFENSLIKEQMNDIIKYRTIEYYRRRYRHSRQRKEQKCTNSKQ